MSDVFSDLKGKFVRVVFQDGDKIRVLRGDLINFDDDVFVLQTLTQKVYIQKARMIKIQDGDDRHGRAEQY